MFRVVISSFCIREYQAYWQAQNQIWNTANTKQREAYFYKTEKEI